MSAVRSMVIALASATAACGILLGSGDDDTTPSTDSGGGDTSDAAAPVPDVAVESAPTDATCDACDVDAGCGDTSTDRSNCGACGRVCASKTCVDGGCDPAVFVTRASWDGRLGGTTGFAEGNKRCAQAAADAGLAGTFLAWLGDGTSGPATKFPTKSARPYRRVDGVVVAANFASFGTGLNASIVIDEKGATVPSSDHAWTGANRDGTSANAGSTCNVWSQADASFGAAGAVSATTALWSYDTDFPCTTAAHVYCVEQ